MELPHDIISQFAKVISKDKKQNSESTVYGTVKTDANGNKYVQLDGSDQLTPLSDDNRPLIDFATATTKDGDRVSVLIKNHTATVTGNLSAPAVSSEEVVDQVEAFNQIVVDQVNANSAYIEQLQTDKADIGELEAAEAKIAKLETEKASIKDLDATNANIENLDASFANIDFTNIGKAAMEYFYAQSGLIENVVVGDQTITGNLVGVTISGDLIEGNTVKADKLVIKGSDGLYYKLNTDGVKIEAQQTDYNSINGQVIKAKSITATKINVDDLVAFDATIGGFNITDNSLYSGVKESVNNTTRGIYLDKDGQMAIGDSNNFMKYYRDTDGSYKLELAVKSLLIEGGTKGRIEYDPVDESLQLTGDNVRLKGNTTASLYSKNYDGANTARAAAVNVTPDRVDMFAQKSTDIDPGTHVGTYKTSELTVEPDRINGLSDEITDTSRNGSTYQSILGDIDILAENGKVNLSANVTIGGKNLIDLIYPIGSIYMSVTYFDPATIFGGTWERLMDRFLLGSGAVYASGQTGGEASHTLTASEMPKHQHSIGYGNTGGYVTLNSGNTKGSYLLPWSADKGYSAADLVALEAGGGAAHNNMPPYLVVNMWKRIA